MKWLIILFSIFAIACEKDSFKQDPLEGQPDRIRNGSHPDQRKPDARPPCSIDSLVIESSPRVGIFEEGQLGTMTFKGRVLDCGTEEYEIEVLNEPEEADYDKTTGVLTYTPPYSIVQGNSFFVERSFKLRMKTLSKPVVIRDHSVVYFVRRPGSRKPVIEDFEKLPDTVNEGSMTAFFVVVRDEDSTSGVNGRINPPHLNLVTTSHNETNALPYMSIFNSTKPVQDPDDKNLWRFRVTINTTPYRNPVDKDMTLRFGVVAVSQFGVLSDPEPRNFELKNRVKKPKITWPELNDVSHKMQKGTRNNFVFWAVDPLKEGYTEVSFVTNCSKLPGTAVCNCEYVGNYMSSSAEKGSYCSIDWDIPANMQRERQNFKVRVVNTNFTDEGDTKSVTLTRTIVLEDAEERPPVQTPVQPHPPEDESNPPVNPPQPDPNEPPGGSDGPVGFGTSQGEKR